MFSNTRSKIL